MNDAVSRRYWVWPCRLNAPTARAILRAASFAEPLVRGLRWLPTAIAVGAIPILLASVLGTSFHQTLTGLLLVPLLLACVVQDRFVRGIAIVVTVIGVHSFIAITLSATDPERAAMILDGSAPYWERTRHWIVTGDDPEYRWRTWLPAHLQLAVGVPLTGYLSLGAIPLSIGVREVDLMNFYVGRLIATSDHPGIAIACGWHPWSIARGLGYAVLLFEVVSWSLTRMVRVELSTRRRRQFRWALGFALAILDAVLKLGISPYIRDQLFANMNMR